MSNAEARPPPSRLIIPIANKTGFLRSTVLIIVARTSLQTTLLQQYCCSSGPRSLRKSFSEEIGGGLLFDQTTTGKDIHITGTLKKRIAAIMRAILPNSFGYLLLLLFVLPLRAEDGSSSGETMQVCSDTDILVTGISLVCDSPGTFYYGSGKYRNSQYCKGGDKAKLVLTFDVVGDISDVDPLLTLEARGDGETVTVYKNARLCYLGTLSSTTKSSCGGYGSFQVSTQFYWTKSTSDDDQSFSPYVSVGFHSEKNPNKYDLGGANTKMCAGNSFLAWSDEIRHSGRFSGPIASLIWSSLILIGTVGMLGVFAWYLWRNSSRDKEYVDDFSRYYDEAEANAADDDYRKIRLIRKEQGLVAF
jgi:hypothetical protein